MIEELHFLFAKNFRYISKSILEKSSASSPPAPEKMVITAPPKSNFPTPRSSLFRASCSRKAPWALSLSDQNSAEPMACSISSIFFFIFSSLGMSRPPDFNPEPTVYDTVALPVELGRLEYIDDSTRIYFIKNDR